MPTYDYQCGNCLRGLIVRTVKIAARDEQQCECGNPLTRQLAAPLGRIAGQVTPGGGPDRFTADCLGIPLKELPDGLKHNYDVTTEKLRPS